MDGFLRDVRHALRHLRQSPGFTLVAVAILALGIGVNSAIFALVNAALLRPQPYAHPEELVNIYVGDSRGEEFVTSSRSEYRAFAERTELFRGTTAFEPQIASRETDDGATVAFVEAVSASYWDVLGVSPLLGRGFLPEEETGGAVVAVIGHQVWQHDFGGTPDVLGRTIRLNGSPVTIVGVAPPEYRGVINALATQYWLPYGSANAIDPAAARRGENRGARGTFVRARLAPGVTAERAQAGIDLVMRQLEQQFPESNEGRRALVVPTERVRFHPAIDGVLYSVAALLLVVVGLVLAIACSNIAGLLLARAAARQREVAVRLAIGAGRGRLIRQLLTESALIGAIGGLAGLVVAWGITRALVAFQPPIPVPVALDLSLDGRVLAFTALLSIVTGVLFGLAPAFRSTRPDLVRSLKSEDRAVLEGRRRLSLRNVLVVGQVAVSVILLAGAGLFVRSLGKAQGIEPGFETDRIAILTVSLDRGNRPTEANRELIKSYVERVRALPGVRQVATADVVPLGLGLQTRGVAIDGYTAPNGETEIEIDYGTVSPEYFATLGIPLVSGRAFEPSDDERAPRVAIVSEAMARAYWGRVDVVGEQVRMGTEPVEIVGVARDTKVRTLGEAPRPRLYGASGQAPPDMVSVLAATTDEPGPVLELMRRALRSTASGLPVFDAKTMPQHLGVALFLPRMAAGLLGAFGLLGLVLAALGLYGVIAFAVAQRTREIGIRMALGARAGEVVRVVVRESVALVSVGLAIGLAIALVATRPLGALLVGVGTSDPLTLGGVAIVLVVAAVLASLIPARRAATVDPLVALRQD